MRAELEEYLRRRSEVLDRLRSTLVQALDLRVDPAALDPDVPLFGSGLRLDSIDSLELVVAVEAEFGVEVTDRENASPEALRTLNTLCDRILR